MTHFSSENGTSQEILRNSHKILQAVFVGWLRFVFRHFKQHYLINFKHSFHDMLLNFLQFCGLKWKAISALSSVPMSCIFMYDKPPTAVVFHENTVVLQDLWTRVLYMLSLISFFLEVAYF